jgi:hypothetical protein
MFTEKMQLNVTTTFSLGSLGSYYMGAGVRLQNSVALWRNRYALYHEYRPNYTM